MKAEKHSGLMKVMFCEHGVDRMKYGCPKCYDIPWGVVK
jgi:hypothetical protein